MAERLAEELRRLRAMRGFSLREVEKATRISNAYLSQLETGKAQNPSPHVLHTLAAFYEVPYESLMVAAGYLKPTQSAERAGKRMSTMQAALMTAKLDEEEESKVAEFIGYLRSQRRHRSK